MALSQGMIDTYWRRYNQRRALTGLPSSYQEVRGTLDPMLEAAASKDIREAELRNQNNVQNRQLSLQEEQARKADRAATVSGVTSLASSGASSYLGYKYLTKPPSAMETAYANYLNAQTPGAAVGSSVPTATAAPQAGAVGGAGSGGSTGVLSGAGSGAVATQTGGGLTSATSMYGETIGAAGEGAGVGLGSTLGTVAGPAALAGGAGGYLANQLHLFGAGKPGHTGGETNTAGAVGGAAAGAMAGAAMTSWSGPGAIVGAVVGGIVGWAGEESVICSELLRQGRITERDRAKCVVFRFRHIKGNMFAAYLDWAKPHVEAMRKGGWRNRIRLPFAHAFIRYMLAIQERRYPAFFERLVWNWAWRECTEIAHKHGAMAAQEVA